MYMSHFVDGQLGCFHLLAIVDNAAVDKYLVPTFSSFGFLPRSGIAASHGIFVLSFLRNHQSVSHSSHALFHSNPQGTRAPALHLLASIFCFPFVLFCL